MTIKEGGFVSIDDGVVALSLDRRRLVVCDNPTVLHELNELVNSLELLGHGDPLVSQRAATGQAWQRPFFVTASHRVHGDCITARIIPAMLMWSRNLYFWLDMNASRQLNVDESCRVR